MTKSKVYSNGNLFSKEKIKRDEQRAVKLKIDSINLNKGYYKKQNKKEKNKSKKLEYEENINENNKIFVLDTCVFIHDPSCMFVFEKNDIVISMTCLEELDNLKSKNGVVGYSARETLRNIDFIFNIENKEIDCVAKIGNNLGFFSIVKDDLNYCKKLGLDPTKNDNIIISTVHNIKFLNPNKEVIFVTRDKCAKIKAIIMGIKTEDYENDKTTTFKLFGDILESNGKIPKNINSVFYQSLEKNDLSFCKISKDIKENFYKPTSMFGISAKNKEQICIIDALLDDNIKVVAISGQAGTGKTMLSLMAGIFQTVDWHKITEENLDILPDKKIKKYDKIIFTRAIIPIGEDIGFLPGDMGEKFGPWMKLVSSNIEFLSKEIKKYFINNGVMKDKRMKIIDESFNNVVDLEPITYMRGINIFNSFVVIDEAQNITPSIMKTIMTRIGEGCKVVILFDPDQLDNRYLDEFSNGASYLIDRYIETEEYFCYIKAKESVRSLIAKRSAELL